ncbi:NAD(P)/FAD-dependent oxidoreductase [Phycicoccus sp. Root101]|uniref:dihydrolipoyl dehydrogenase family protein n=1 Tax=Phycicoccus sp. Root101 TaxID=1736421 RepID=UPI0007034D28|nr:NAD(P)/FAD-dependent oxidoreductase [Phycicoccus sp. Root101]KQU68963.1 pyridine nucleotide-disulfide oxidoreductase [Phycicoccus sp. Root101]
MITHEYDVVVLGAGAVGENVADRAVRGGLTVALIEGELVGGDCSYWACMPSKALLRPAGARQAAHGTPGTPPSVLEALDVESALATRDRFASHWDDTGQAEWVANAGIDLIRGRGRLSGRQQVTVATEEEEQVLNARHAVAVATGSDAYVPDIEGLGSARPWTSRQATSVKHVPRSLAIIGGGVVAVEMATAYASLGCQVYVIARSGLLQAFEPFAGKMVAGALRDLGIGVFLHTGVQRVHRTTQGRVQLTTTAGQVSADEVLVATGRAPRTDDIGLETVGLTPGSWLTTDDTLRVQGYDWLYGVGDVNRRAFLTHQGKYQARAAGDVIAARAAGRPVENGPWGRHVATADLLAVPQVVFTRPEVACVGFTARAATNAGYRAHVVDYDLGAVAGSSLHADGYKGYARMVVDQERQVILGATLVGQDVGELIHAATVAVAAEVPLHRLWHAVPSYPTMSEIWLRLLETNGRTQPQPRELV